MNNSRTNWRLRGAAIRKGLIVPHPIPCRLVKDENGNWVEGAWVNDPKADAYIGDKLIRKGK